jgi:hypothetical protein
MQLGNAKKPSAFVLHTPEIEVQDILVIPKVQDRTIRAFSELIIESMATKTLRKENP